MVMKPRDNKILFKIKMLKNVRQGKYMQKKVICFQGTGSNFESKELTL